MSDWLFVSSRMEINLSEATGSAENTSNVSREKGPWWPLGQRHNDWLTWFQMTKWLSFCFCFSIRSEQGGVAKTKSGGHFCFCFCSTISISLIAPLLYCYFSLLTLCLPLLCLVSFPTSYWPYLWIFCSLACFLTAAKTSQLLLSAFCHAWSQHPWGHGQWRWWSDGARWFYLHRRKIMMPMNELNAFKTLSCLTWFVILLVDFNEHKVKSTILSMKPSC